MKSPIIIALDMEIKSALELAQKIDPKVCKVKVGSELFTKGGPKVIEKLKDLGFDVFLDLKFHDIPIIKLYVLQLKSHSSICSNILFATSSCKGLPNFFFASKATDVAFFSHNNNKNNKKPSFCRKKSPKIDFFQFFARIFFFAMPMFLNFEAKLYDRMKMVAI